MIYEFTVRVIVSELHCTDPDLRSMGQNYGSGSESFTFELHIMLKAVDVNVLGKHFPEKLSSVAGVLKKENFDKDF